MDEFSRIAAILINLKENVDKNVDNDNDHDVEVISKVTNVNKNVDTVIDKLRASKAIYLEVGSSKYSIPP